jgi:phosphopantothenoylcysteine synthetase/decarboxylase
LAAAYPGFVAAEENLASERLLYLIISGAVAPEGVPALVELLQAAGWHVMVFSTPIGTRFVDMGKLERLTGQPVRSEYRMPGTGSPVPPSDAVLACPLSFNSVNKFAHGHADNFAIGLLCEMTGYGVPTVVVPHCKPQLASHPAFTASLETLRGMGVRVLFDPDAPDERRLPPWSEVVAALPVTAGRPTLTLAVPGGPARSLRAPATAAARQRAGSRMAAADRHVAWVLVRQRPITC